MARRCDMAKHDEVLLDEVRPGLLVLTLNRPASLNAINDAMIDAFHARVDQIDRDRRSRVLVMTGAGRGFCSGADLRRGWDDAPTAEKETPSDVSFFGQRRLSQLVAPL